MAKEEPVAEDPDLQTEIVLDDLPQEQGADTSFPLKAGAPYDPTEDREEKRGQIALTLIKLLVGVVAGGFLLVVAKVACLGFGGTTMCDALSVVEVRPLIEMFLTPIVGLVGAVTGFYFGGKKG